MTREEAKLKVWNAHCNFDDPRKAINIVVDQIFNDHEAQLKAKDKITQDIKEAYELKSIAYDLLLEAIQLKDEEIERLKELIRRYESDE